MSESPTVGLGFVGRILLVLAILFVVLPFILSPLVDTGGLPGKEATVGAIEFHLVLGFALFLFREFSALVTDAGIWAALVVLIALAAGLAWLLGKLWQRRHGSHWSARQRLVLTVLLATWFGVSFLVCEGLRQAGEFRRSRWTTPDYATHHASMQRTVVWLRYPLWEIAREGDRYPESLAEVGKGSGFGQLLFHEDAEMPPERPIYLAGGLPTKLDPGFPLLISPCYRGPAGVWTRTVITGDVKVIEIDDAETDEWIQRAFDMRRASLSP